MVKTLAFALSVTSILSGAGSVSADPAPRSQFLEDKRSPTRILKQVKIEDSYRKARRATLAERRKMRSMLARERFIQWINTTNFIRRKSPLLQAKARLQQRLENYGITFEPTLSLRAPRQTMKLLFPLLSTHQRLILRRVKHRPNGAESISQSSPPQTQLADFIIDQQKYTKAAPPTYPIIEPHDETHGGTVPKEGTTVAISGDDPALKKITLMEANTMNKQEDIDSKDENKDSEVEKKKPPLTWKELSEKTTAKTVDENDLVTEINKTFNHLKDDLGNLATTSAGEKHKVKEENLSSLNERLTEAENALSSFMKLSPETLEALQEDYTISLGVDKETDTVTYKTKKRDLPSRIQKIREDFTKLASIVERAKEAHLQSESKDPEEIVTLLSEEPLTAPTPHNSGVLPVSQKEKPPQPKEESEIQAVWSNTLRKTLNPLKENLLKLRKEKTNWDTPSKEVQDVVEKVNTYRGFLKGTFNRMFGKTKEEGVTPDKITGDKLLTICLEEIEAIVSADLAHSTLKPKKLKKEVESIDIWASIIKAHIAPYLKEE